MKKRIVTGTILAAVVFCFLVYASEYLFGVGVFSVAILAAYEWLKLTKISSDLIIKNLIIFSIIIFFVSSFFVYLQFMILLFWLYVILRLSQYERNKIDNVSAKEMLIMGFFAISPFCASLYVLHSNGIAWIFVFILVVAVADSAAYFIGKFFGKKKILPRLSPNKTVEGLLGGFVGAILFALIFLFFMNLSFGKYLYMVLVFVLVALASVLGDAFESMVKRVAGVKDSGNILPGHGGILDRIDSYIPTLPLFVTLGYIGGVFVI